MKLQRVRLCEFDGTSTEKLREAIAESIDMPHISRDVLEQATRMEVKYIMAALETLLYYLDEVTRRVEKEKEAEDDRD